MASIIEGYEYDIFISYRQKDNKHNGWVTEFVNNLKGELESTFKEEVSVYFDINPHDGLLETHDVDASLKDKLKCLVFVPIISRTYCDPKSFAWEHEFKSFIDQSSRDQFGPKVKLLGGNITNRVLPVQIHELDLEDKKLVENELGGYLRGIEFIYKELGVNRPLTPKDSEDKNTNKTNYRNQINKVANAIKEIITGMSNSRRESKEATKSVAEEKPESRKNLKTQIIAGSFIFLVLIILGFLVFPKFIKPSKQLEKSIAVLPFRNDSPDSTNQYFINGTMEAILDNLCKIADLTVVSRTSVEQFRNTTRSIHEIAKRLNVNYILEGSGQKYGNDIRLTVQLIDAVNDKHIWSCPYEGVADNIFILQSQISEAIASELKAIISPEEKQLIEKTPTTNLTAHDFYLRGREEYVKYWIDNDNREALEKAEKLYCKALEYDHTFAQAYTGLAQIYWNKHYWEDFFSENFQDSTIILCDIALSLDHQLSEVYTLKGTYYSEIGKSEQAIEEFDKAIQYNPNDWMAYYERGILYSTVDLVKSIDNFQKAASLNRGEQLPELLRSSVGWEYMLAGFPEKAYYYWKEALNLDGDSSKYYACLGFNEFYRGNYEKAIEYTNKVYSIDSTANTYSYTFVALALNYIFLGNYEESLKYINKHLELLESLKQTDIGNEWIIGYIFWKSGYKEKAEYFFDETKKNSNRMIDLGRAYAQAPEVYYDLAAIYAFKGEMDKAYKNLRIFSQKPCVEIKWGTLLKNDPLFNRIRTEGDFQQITRDVEAKYQAEHERVKKWLEEQGML
jgi:TolB-like protein/Tfp pilus assembly protein PilF